MQLQILNKKTRITQKKIELKNGTSGQKTEIIGHKTISKSFKNIMKEFSDHKSSVTISEMFKVLHENKC